MIENLVDKLMKAETTDELLSYKSIALDLYDSLYKKMKSDAPFRTSFDDIKALNDLKFPMMAYYGPYFCAECGFPFIKEHNPKTIDVLELTVLFYTIQVMNLLETGFYSDAELCIYKTSPEIFDHIEKINLTEYRSKRYLFITLWYYFVQIITIKDNERTFSMEYDDNIATFYLTDEKYEEVLDMIYRNYGNSNYSYVIDKILGIYKLRFTKMEYILKYQPLFVNVGYEYLCTLEKNKR